MSMAKVCVHYYDFYWMGALVFRLKRGIETTSIAATR